MSQLGIRTTANDLSAVSVGMKELHVAECGKISCAHFNREHLGHFFNVLIGPKNQRLKLIFHFNEYK